ELKQLLFKSFPSAVTFNKRFLHLTHAINVDETITESSDIYQIYLSKLTSKLQDAIVNQTITYNALGKPFTLAEAMKLVCQCEVVWKATSLLNSTSSPPASSGITSSHPLAALNPVTSLDHPIVPAPMDLSVTQSCQVQIAKTSTLVASD